MAISDRAMPAHPAIAPPHRNAVNPSSSNATAAISTVIEANTFIVGDDRQQALSAAGQCR